MAPGADSPDDDAVTQTSCRDKPSNVRGEQVKPTSGCGAWGEGACHTSEKNVIFRLDSNTGTGGNLCKRSGDSWAVTVLSPPPWPVTSARLWGRGLQVALLSPSAGGHPGGHRMTGPGNQEGTVPFPAARSGAAPPWPPALADGAPLPRMHPA